MILDKLAHRHPFKTLFAVTWTVIAMLTIFFGPVIGS